MELGDLRSSTPDAPSGRPADPTSASKARLTGAAAPGFYRTDQSVGETPDWPGAGFVELPSGKVGNLAERIW